MTVQADDRRTILYGPMMVPDSKWIKKALFYAEDFATFTPLSTNAWSQEWLHAGTDLGLCAERGVWSPVNLYRAVPDDKLNKLVAECIAYSKSPVFLKNRGSFTRDDRVFAQKFPYTLERALLESGHLEESTGKDGREQLRSRYEGLVPTLLTIFTRAVAEDRGWVWDVTDRVHARQALESGMFKDIPSHQGVVTTIKRTLVPSESTSVEEILNFREKHQRQFNTYMKSLRAAEQSDRILDPFDLEETGKELNARIKELELVARRSELPLSYRVKHFLEPITRGSVMFSGSMTGVGMVGDALTPELNVHFSAIMTAIGIVYMGCQMRGSAVGGSFLSTAAKNSMFARMSRDQISKRASVPG